MTRYAVNICDLVDAMGEMAALVFADFCTKDSPVVYIDKSLLDTIAIVLDGLAAQDAARVTALIEMLQTIIGPYKIRRRIRCYREGPKGGWKEIRPKEKHEEENDSGG